MFDLNFYFPEEIKIIQNNSMKTNEKILWTSYIGGSIFAAISPKIFRYTHLVSAVFFSTNLFILFSSSTKNEKLQNYKKN